MLGAVQGCVKSSTRMLAFFGIFKKLGEKKLDKKRGLSRVKSFEMQVAHGTLLLV